MSTITEDWYDVQSATVRDEPYLQDGHLTARAIEVYTQGECWYLAAILRQLTGAPLAYVNLGAKLSDFSWIHLLVQLGPDTYLDIHGVQTAQQVLTRWPGIIEGVKLKHPATLLTATSTQTIEFGEHDPADMPATLQVRTEAVAQHLLAGI